MKKFYESMQTQDWPCQSGLLRRYFVKKIMIADDSPIVRNLMKITLFKTYELVEAENGQDAVEKAKQNDIDLFLLDLNMPNMSGIEAAKELRKLDKYKTKPILICTIEVKEEKKQEGREAGVNGWIVKTGEPAKMLEVIDKLINK
jgi:two-component system, chemotaxis family, chemotaxis protein CheY